MCTSITMTAQNNSVLLARTMDFSFELDPEMSIFPRNYPLHFMHKKSILDTHYAFMGLSQDIGGRFLADGLNETGLAGAALYFEGYASYENSVQGDALAPHEVLMWALAQCEDVLEVKKMFTTHQIVAAEVDFIKNVPPLHWVFTDRSGASIIVEPKEEGVMIYDNNLGVLTNSPDYPWHHTNVRNYIGVSPKQVESKEIYGEEFKPFGQGSGTFGIPGDFTPPSRFIRALYAKLGIQTAKDDEELLVNAIHVLNQVDIPKGNVITPRNTLDYTQYTSYMNLSENKFYYRLYDALSIREISLSAYDLDEKEVIIL